VPGTVSWWYVAGATVRPRQFILMLEHWHHGRHATPRAARLLAEWAESQGDRVAPALTTGRSRLRAR